MPAGNHHIFARLHFTTEDSPVVQWKVNVMVIDYCQSTVKLIKSTLSLVEGGTVVYSKLLLLRFKFLRKHSEQDFPQCNQEFIRSVSSLSGWL